MKTPTSPRVASVDPAGSPFACNRNAMILM